LLPHAGAQHDALSPGKVDKTSGVLDVSGRGAPEFPPSVRKPDFDEASRLYLDKHGLVLVLPAPLCDVVERLK
jgi:hypothetical protein